jgi:putative acyl-CoA dehydrogenase
MRAAARSPEAVAAFMAELDAANGGDRRYDAAVGPVRQSFDELDEQGARRMVERAAIALQASLLIRFAPPEVSDAFIGSRIADPGLAYGAQSVAVAIDPILERVLPV